MCYITTESWWKRAEEPDFNTVSYYPQGVVGREQSNLTSTLHTATTEGREQSDLTSILYILLLQTICHITTESWWKGAKQPDFNTIYCYYQQCATLPQKVDGREQSDLTSTLYTATTEGREQCDLTSILYTATTNTMLYYHRKLMEGSKATWLKHCLQLAQIVDGKE